MSLVRRHITPADKARAVLAALRRQWPHRRLRITEGQRRAIVNDAAYRRGVLASDDRPRCARCGAIGQVGNPLLGHPPAELVCLRCRKAERA